MKMLDRTCPICQRGDNSIEFALENFDEQLFGQFAFSSRKVPEYMHYRLLLCTLCDLIYASPVPELSWLVNAYEEAAYDSGEEASFAAGTYATLLPQILRLIPDAQRALDIGTGSGAFLEELLKANFGEVIGVEPSQAPIKAAKENIRPLIRQDVFRASDFESESFSLITCFQTLEHLYDPLCFIKDVADLLKPGGVFYCVIHDHRALSARILGLKSPIFDIEHLQLFSQGSICELLRKNDFEALEVKGIWNVYPVNYWLKLFPLPKPIKKILLNVFRNKRYPIAMPAGNLACIGIKKH